MIVVAVLLMSEASDELVVATDRSEGLRGAVVVSVGSTEPFATTTAAMMPRPILRKHSVT